MKKEEKQKKILEKSSNRRIIIISAVIILIILFLFFGAKIYLWINLLLGNDVIIRLNADTENLFLVNEQSQEITFTSSILTNPFCSSDCDFSFNDLSKGEILYQDSFTIKPAMPISKKYVLKAPENGIGQKLYRFDILCKAKKTFLCNTAGDIISKSFLITLNYNLNENNKKIKQDFKNKLTYFFENSNLFILSLDSLEQTIDELNKTIELDNMPSLNETKNSVLIFNQSLESLKNIWETGDYSPLSEIMDKKQEIFSEIESKFQLINETISSNTLIYNSLINNLVKIEFRLKDMQNINLTNETLIELNKLIKNFNYSTKSFVQKNSLDFKSILVSNLINQTDFVSNLIVKSEQETHSYLSEESIISLNISRITLNYPDFSLNLSFKEPNPICCLFGKCRECCNDSCYSEKDKFPVLFLHGHDFNKALSAEYNLNIFDKMQRNLEKDGFLNAGTILLSSSKEEENGILGKNAVPISLRGSYYFDIFKTTESTTILQTKKDSIDTYSIRLKDIINEVKYKTNREKVIIVAYSMGGLVARRYIQLFGESDVDKLVLIAAPNKGITGNALNYCSFFGAETECNDMNKDSLFLNKLNTGKKPNLQIFNLIGLGCDTDKEPGDGIVKNSSAYLEYANNSYVTGTCKGINVFHTEILLPDKYPEVYKFINSSVR